MMSLVLWRGLVLPLGNVSLKLAIIWGRWAGRGGVTIQEKVCLGFHRALFSWVDVTLALLVTAPLPYVPWSVAGTYPQAITSVSVSAGLLLAQYSGWFLGAAIGPGHSSRVPLGVSSTPCCPYWPLGFKAKVLRLRYLNDKNERELEREAAASRARERARLAREWELAHRRSVRASNALFRELAAMKPRR